jgi:ATP-binding cassette subfamily F protein 3
MDEPTNHLDIWSREALERSINDFEGTVLVVSHDRYFLNQVADRLIVMASGRARVIEGDYETYQHLVQQEKERASGADRKAPVAPAAPAAAQKASPAATQKASPARPKRKFPYRKAVDIEREIADLEKEITELEDLLGQPATWRDPVRAVGTQQRHSDLKNRLDALYQHWETALEANW